MFGVFHKLLRTIKLSMSTMLIVNYVNYVKNVSKPFNFSRDSLGITIPVRSLIQKIYHELWSLKNRTWYKLLYIILHSLFLLEPFGFCSTLARSCFKSFFVMVHKKSRLRKSLVNLVKMSMFLCSLAICQVSSIFVADYG